MPSLDLLPWPQHVEQRPGRVRLAGPLHAAVPPAQRAALAPALQEVRRALAEPGIPTTRDGLALEIRPDARSATESYELTVSRHGVTIAGDAPAGLRHGLHTLAQLVRSGRGWASALRITDAPAFQQRGYYLDISRGKVPRMAELRRLVRLLAHLKINQLQLYVEHVFAFQFDPDIAAGCAPLTAAQVRDLDVFCRQHGVELVPSMTCFGHMGRILSLPAYRDLAEIPWTHGPWKRAPWLARLRGVTLDPRQPGSRALVRRMTDEFLPLFRSGRFNLCGDETYDLGRGRNAAYAARHGIARLYLDHLRYVAGLAARHGKRIMFWSDVLLKHPAAIPGIPGDFTVLDWGYEAVMNFRKAEVFRAAGLPVVVCPSVRGYKVVFNEVETARANICGYARAGRDLGAVGLLNTDWGDLGHFNLRAASRHGLALGAAMAWNPDGPAGADFDRLLGAVLFGPGRSAAAAAELFPAAGRFPLASWPYFYRGAEALAGGPPDPATAAAARDQAQRIGRLAEALRPGAWLADLDVTELRLAARALALNAEQAALPGRGTAAARRHAGRRRDFSAEYGAAWVAGNRRAGWREMRAALARAADRAAGSAAAAP